MEAETYPDPRVTEFITRNLIPVRLHVKSHPEAFERFGAQWTPTVLLLDPSGHERHRIEGYLPADDFLIQLHLGLARAAFRANQFTDAERLYNDIVKQFPDSDAAAEAQYWAGVANYKGSNDAAALKRTADAFKQRYSDTEWAKRASVWG